MAVHRSHGLDSGRRQTPPRIVAELKKLDFLRVLGAAGWDLSEINPNRLKFLAQLGRRATSQALQRLAPERRYPILAAFLRQSVEEITDEVVDLYDRCLAQSYARASRALTSTPIHCCKRWSCCEL